MKWYPADWINDTRELSPEAKAAWIDILCLMWNAPERGVWKGSYEQFARATGLPWEIAPRVVTELSHKTSRVTFRDSEVTIENRRMVNQEIDYKDNANRQAKFRSKRTSNEKVTDKTLDSSRLLNITKTTTNTLAQAPKPPSFTKPLLEEVRTYVTASSLTVDASQFLDHYEANGWRVGRSLMKDWKAAVRNWDRRNRIGGINAGTNSPKGAYIGTQAPVGKYATITENR